VRANLSEEKPVFLQIKEMIEEDILEGTLAEDSPIPSSTELVAFYRINPATVLKGINLLVDEQILYKKRGIGMYVAQGAQDLLRTRRRKAFCDDRLASMVQEATRLGIGKKELIQMIEAQLNKTEEVDQ